MQTGQGPLFSLWLFSNRSFANINMLRRAGKPFQSRLLLPVKLVQLVFRPLTNFDRQYWNSQASKAVLLGLEPPGGSPAARYKARRTSR